LGAALYVVVWLLIVGTRSASAASARRATDEPVRGEDRHTYHEPKVGVRARR
jgi:hypothetical protein